MTPIQISEILPCPFCGMEMIPRNGGKYHQHPTSQCTASEICLHIKRDYDEWNTRAPLAVVPSEQELANILDDCPYICFDNGCNGSMDAARKIRALLLKGRTG